MTDLADFRADRDRDSLRLTLPDELGDFRGMLVIEPLLLIQRFCYRQLLYIVAVQVALAALKGRMLGWNKLMRTGSVTLASPTNRSAMVT